MAKVKYREVVSAIEDRVLEILTGYSTAPRDVVAQELRALIDYAVVAPLLGGDVDYTETDVYDVRVAERAAAEAARDSARDSADHCTG